MKIFDINKRLSRVKLLSFIFSVPIDLSPHRIIQAVIESELLRHSRDQEQATKFLVQRLAMTLPLFQSSVTDHGNYAVEIEYLRNIFLHQHQVLKHTELHISLRYPT